MLEGADIIGVMNANTPIVTDWDEEYDKDEYWGWLLGKSIVFLFLFPMILLILNNMFIEPLFSAYMVISMLEEWGVIG